VSDAAGPACVFFRALRVLSGESSSPMPLDQAGSGPGKGLVEDEEGRSDVEGVGWQRAFPR
jgi:hypothetical protein